MNIKNISKEDFQKMYNDFGIIKMKKILKTSFNSLKQKLFELNIDKRKITRTKINISKEELIELYNKNSIIEISKNLKCCHSLITKLIKKYNIPIKERNIKRKYKINQNFFNSLNKTNMYWLGFIAADGSLSEKEKRLSINLSNKDYDHLVKFKNALDSNLPIFIKSTKESIYKNRKIKSTKVASIRVSSKQMTYDLIKLGIYKNKTLTYVIPEFILNHNLINHFIRGYVDGDGCWSKKKNGQMSFSVCGSFEFCNQIKYLFLEKQFINKKFKYLKQQGKIWTLNISGNIQCKKIIYWMYNDYSVVLDRKYEIIKELLSERAPLMTVQYHQ